MDTERTPGPGRRVNMLISARLPDTGPVVAPDIAWLVQQDLFADRELLAAWVNTQVTRLVYDAVQVHLYQTRQARHDTVVAYGAGPVRAAASTEVRASRRRVDWLRWLEHARDRHIPIGEMRRADLYVAAAERTNRGHQELERGALWAALAAGLPDERATVADVFSNEAIERLALSITVRSAWESDLVPANAGDDDATA